ncbi:hypothetical protein ACIQ8D_30500 [Streptomyces sp. NPDC096094]|uniref:hypothetical protein n=1 Tax=Streptomyces sp. NPDC096094 TaxID=3366073 RepID=UPI003802343D
MTRGARPQTVAHVADICGGDERTEGAGAVGVFLPRIHCEVRFWVRRAGQVVEHRVADDRGKDLLG